MSKFEQYHTREFLKKWKPYLKYTNIAKACGIDKNVLSDFIVKQKTLKPYQHNKLARFIRTLKQ